MSETRTEAPISLTEAAAARVRKLIEKDGRPGVFLRVGVKGGGCSGLEYVMRLETEERPNDVRYEIAGVPVVVDTKSKRFLSGSEIDFTSRLVGGGFRVTNPNAARSCGCGTSFTPK